MKEKTIFIKVLDTDDEWFSSSYFNGNAYPKEAQKSIESCWKRFSLILSYYRNMSKQIKTDLSFFLDWSNHNITKVNMSNKDKVCEVSYISMSYISFLYGMFITVKSFLDLWSKTCVTIIDPKSNLHGFNKKNIDGRELAGGSFINWLTRSAPANSNGEKLASLTKNHSLGWIHEVVGFRDQIIHYGEIENLNSMRLLIKGTTNRRYEKSDIILPQMPNKESIIDYCQSIVSHLNIYLIDCIKLLPKIKHGYLKLKPFEFRDYLPYFPTSKSNLEIT